MTTILLSALDRPAAERIQARLTSHPIMPVPDTPDAAIEAAQTADALLVLVNTGWAEAVQSRPAQLAAIEAGLRRSSLLIVTLLLDDAGLPPVTELPESLRALAYMTAVTVHTGEGFDLDMQRLDRQLAVYLAQPAGATAQVAPVAVPAQPARRRIPWNLVLIVVILVIGVLLMLAARLRRDTLADAVAEVTTTPQDTARPAEVLIGLAAGLSGGMETRGQTMWFGAQLALADRPVIRVGDSAFPVDLLPQDTRCSSLGGLQVAEVFVSAPGMVGVIGDMCDIACRAAVPVYDAAGLATISPGCTAPGLTLDPSTSFNRVIPSQAQAAKEAADFVFRTLRIPRAAVIHDEQIVGGQLAAAFAAQFANQGGQISGYYEVESRTLSIPDLVEAVLREGPELIYYAGRAANAANLKIALVGDGITGLPLFLGDPTVKRDYATLVGAAGTTSYTLELLPPQGAAMDALAARYTETYSSPPPDPIFAYAYDAANMLLDALEATATLDADGELVIDRAALQHAVRAYQGEGVTGWLACNGQGDCGAAASAALVWVDNEFVPYAP